MTRIPYPVVEELSDSVRKTVETAQLNALRMFAHCTPAAFEGFFAFSSAFFTSSTLPPLLRQIGILRAAHIARSDYVIQQHEALARDLGLDDAALDAVRQGGSHSDALTPAQQAVLDFADQLIVDVRASDAVLANVRRHLDETQLLDLMMVIGLYMTMSRMIETTGVEPDMYRINSDFLGDLLD